MTEDLLKFEVRVLITRGESKWVAQGIEFDIAAQGDTPGEAQRQFARVFAGQIVADQKYGVNPLSNIPRAPQEVIRQYQDGIRADVRGGIPSDCLPPHVIADLNETRFADR